MAGAIVFNADGAKELLQLNDQDSKDNALKIAIDTYIPELSGVTMDSDRREFITTLVEGSIPLTDESLKSLIIKNQYDLVLELTKNNQTLKDKALKFAISNTNFIPEGTTVTIFKPISANIIRSKSEEKITDEELNEEQIITLTSDQPRNDFIIELANNGAKLSDQSLKTLKSQKQNEFATTLVRVINGVKSNDDSVYQEYYEKRQSDKEGLLSNSIHHIMKPNKKGKYVAFL